MDTYKTIQENAVMVNPPKENKQDINIKQIIKETPNDLELGQKIRKLFS